MRRLSTALALFTVLPTAFVALPVTSRLHPRPHPVAPVVRALATHLASDGSEVASQSASRFSVVGARWDHGTLRPGVQVEVRAHGAHGWSSWTAMTPTDLGADAGSADARAAGRRHSVATDVADPVWVGASDGVQLRAIGPRGVRKPGHLSVVLVDPGRSDADADVGSPAVVGGGVAEAAVTKPQIYSRAQWGADESLRLSACPAGPDYGSTIKVGFVHHTDGTNGYAMGDVPAIIRGIYAYHVQSNGWCDIGYNFLVDRFGRIWEGRYGGVDRPVIGAHTGGFNTNSFAASLIGNYASTTPSSAMVSAIEKLYAWKLGSYYRDPLGSEYLLAGSFSGSKYATGTNVKFRIISGHRDADYTTCPGDAAYNLLPTIRNGTFAALGAGFIAPSVSPTSRKVGETGGFPITFGAVTGESWQVTVANSAGLTVNTLTGSASRSAPTVRTTWQGTDASGVPVAPGAYTLTLTGQTPGGATAIPWKTTVQIVPPVSLTGPATTAYNTRVTLTGSASPNSSVVVHVQPSNASVPTDTTLTSAGDGTFSLPYQMVRDTTWWATANGWDSPKGTTRIAPTASAPAYAKLGDTVNVTGTALPGSQVALLTRPVGGAFTTHATTTAATDGSWTAQITADKDYEWQASSNGLSTPVALLRAVPPPSASAPATAGYGATVTVTGMATAPTGVTLYTAPTSSSSFTQAASMTAGSNGSFGLQFPLKQDTQWYVATAYGKSPVGVTKVAPTVANPALVRIGTTVTGTTTSMPGAAITLYRRAVGTTSWGSPVASRTAASDGRATWTWTADRSAQWLAVSRNLNGNVATTIAAPPPTVAGPPTGTYGGLAGVSGTAPPGSVVRVWMKRGSEGGYTYVAPLRADSAGRLHWAFRLTANSSYYVQGATGQSNTATTWVRPAVSGPTYVRLGTIVTVNVRTLPNSTVTLYYRRSSTSRWLAIRNVTSSSTGGYAWRFAVRYPIQVCVRSNGFASNGLAIRTY